MEAEQLVMILVLGMVALALPVQSLLLFAILPLTLLSDGFQVLPPLLEIGEAQVRASDGLLIAVGGKVLLLVLAKRRRLQWHAAYGPLLTYLGILFVAIWVAYLRFGQAIFEAEMTAFARMLASVVVLALLVVGMGPRQPTISLKLLDALGYVIALSVGINLVSGALGLELGEVQTGEGMTRTFGPIGDQVGFMLSYFAFAKILERKLLAASFFALCIYATGTRGALAVLIVGLGFMVWKLREEIGLTRGKLVASALVLAVFLGLLVVQDVGGLRLRYSPEQLRFTLEERLMAARVALQVFRESPLLGIGFTGFRYLAWDYVEGDRLARILATQRSPMSTAENQYLQVLADGGLLALAAFVWMMAVFLKTFRAAASAEDARVRTQAQAGYIWLLALLVGNQTAAWLIPSSLIATQLWLVLGLAIIAQQARARVRRVRGEAVLAEASGPVPLREMP